MPRASWSYRSIPLFILVLWLATTSAVMAGPPIKWSKIFNLGGDDFATDVRQTRDGGYIISANTMAGRDYAWLIKLNGSGDIQWKKSYKSSSSDVAAWGVARLNDGGYAWAGEKNNAMFVLKTDSKGKTVWEKKLDGGWAWGVRAVSDGGVSVCGQGPDESDMFVRLDKSGKLLWKKSFGYNMGTSIQETRAKKGFNISGYDESGNSFLARTDKRGRTLWMRVFEGDLDTNRKFMEAIETADGGFAIIERDVIHYRDGEVDYLDYPNYLLKTDSRGNQLWRRLINTKAWRLHETQDHGLITAGSTVDDYFEESLSSMQLHRFDRWGNELWMKILDGVGLAYGFSAQQSADKGSIIVGHTRTQSGNNQIYIVKMK